jgi:hypothetical protein
MRKILLALVTIIFSFIANSQIADRCGSNEAIKQQMAADPAYAKKVEALLKNKGSYSRSDKKGKPPCTDCHHNSSSSSRCV